MEGHYSTNSREAFETSYNKGLRVFEVDLHSTLEGSTVLYHDVNNWHEMIGNEDTPISYSEFIDRKLYSKYQTLDVNSLVELMNEYPDTYFIIDYGGPDEHEAAMWYTALTYYGSKYEGVLDRIIIEVVDDETLDVAFSIYPWKGCVFTYYKEKWEGIEEAIRFCKYHNIKAVQYTAHAYDVDGAKEWIDKGYYVIIFTENDSNRVEELIKAGISAVYVDDVQ